ncbi:MAG: hypothetical protein JOZ96_11900 [Acidobacteria bacterium]|nr:hypothetical protein [Acidobacteriota bacterium]
MHKRARSWGNWLAPAIILLILGAGVASFAGPGQSQGDKHSLKNDVSELKSRAGTGRLVAEQALAGNLTRNFVEAQAEQMRKGVAQTRDKLTPEQFGPELSAQVLQAADLARRLEGALNSLRGAGADRQAAESARKNLAGLFEELSRLEEDLKE